MDLKNVWLRSKICRKVVILSIQTRPRRKPARFSRIGISRALDNPRRIRLASGLGAPLSKPMLLFFRMRIYRPVNQNERRRTLVLRKFLRFSHWSKEFWEIWYQYFDKIREKECRHSIWFGCPIIFNSSFQIIWMDCYWLNFLQVNLAFIVSRKQLVVQRELGSLRLSQLASNMPTCFRFWSVSEHFSNIFVEDFLKRLRRLYCCEPNLYPLFLSLFPTLERFWSDEP